MCCFSRPVKHVSQTQIFARQLAGGQQALAYSMNVEIDAELAMILPIPTMPGTPDDGVSFLDLSGYPKLFVDLRAAFPEIVSRAKGGFRLAPQSRQARPKLEVHDVGAFVASFVPSRRDFDRLDERFRLSTEVFATHEEYDDWGFAVFQLKPRKGWFGGIKRQTIHPMAFRFPSRKPRALFYPTLHVHDGHVPDEAVFDHSLYAQVTDPVLDATLPFARSEKKLDAHVDVARAAGLVDGAAAALREVMLGSHTNQDQWYDPPECAGVHVLRADERFFSFKLSVTAAYINEFGHKPARKWHQVARTKADALHAGLLEGVSALTRERSDDWRLLPLAPDLTKAWLSNNDVYLADEATGIFRPEPGKEIPLRLAIPTRTDAVETQQVELAFRYVPSAEVVAEISACLDEIVARALA